MEALVGLTAGMLGAVLGATLTWITGRRHSQVNMAFDMHREYNSQAMMMSRERGGRTAKLYPDVSIIEMWQKVDLEEMQDILSVLNFYERLWMAVRASYVKRSLVPTLFGYSFEWWYAGFFARQVVPIDDPIARHIQGLHKWMLQHASEDEIAGWKDYRKQWVHTNDSTDPSTDEDETDMGPARRDSHEAM